jgi:hypothetical protein
MECLHCNGFGYRVFEGGIERKARASDLDDLLWEEGKDGLNSK